MSKPASEAINKSSKKDRNIPGAGIEVMDLEDGESTVEAEHLCRGGMGCTGPIIRVSDANLAKAEEELKRQDISIKKDNGNQWFSEKNKNKYGSGKNQ